jgi:N-dimethylarginine dimethylaminohydrolase
MKIGVNAHWDKLQYCIVGQTYSPEFYSFVENERVRSAIQQIAKETREDLDNLAKRLEDFGVTVIRPVVSNNVEDYMIGTKILPAPLTPRDHMAVVDDILYCPTPDRLSKWRQIKGDSWPEEPPASWDTLSDVVKEDLVSIFNITEYSDLFNWDHSWMQPVIESIVNAEQRVVYDSDIDSAMVHRLGNRIIVGNWFEGDMREDVVSLLEQNHPNSNVTLVETCGHLDGTFCVVKEGLVVASNDLPDSVYAELLPGYTVIRVSKSIQLPEFSHAKLSNKQKWWVPEELGSSDFEQYVNKYLSNWMGEVNETSVGVNMLMVDETNVFCTVEDPHLYEQLSKHGITPHYVPFRHHIFWDSGLHCVTNDLRRESA